MESKEVVKIIIPYFYEQSIELYIEENLFPEDLEMIRFNVLENLASEKDREEIIQNMKQYLTRTGFSNVKLESENTNKNIIEFPILL